jgi:hypothetical protein
MWRALGGRQAPSQAMRACLGLCRELPHGKTTRLGMPNAAPGSCRRGWEITKRVHAGCGRVWRSGALSTAQPGPIHYPAMPSATALEHLVGNMQLAELAQRSGKSVSEIVAFAMGTKSSNGTTARLAKHGSPRASATPTAKRSAATAVDTRTRQGRAELDQRMLDAIRSLGTAKAKDLEGVGGDELQRRASLHRLMASKQIRREGVARGTVYRAK